MRIMSQEAFNHMVEWMRKQGIWLDLTEAEQCLSAYAEEFGLVYQEEK